MTDLCRTDKTLEIKKEIDAFIAALFALFDFIDRQNNNG